MEKKKCHPAWTVLLGVIFIRGFCNGGINMTSGLFLSPVARELGVGIGTLTIYFSISSLVMVLSLPWAGKLLQRYDVRLVTAAAAALQALSFSAFGLCSSVYGWYLLCIPQAMGAAVTVSLLGPVMTGRWFSGSVGTPIGLVLACGSLLGAVLQPLASWLIDRQGWRTGYMAMGLVVFAASLVSALVLLKNSPQDRKVEPYDTKGRQRTEEALVEIPEKTALHSASFVLLLLFGVLMTGVGVFTQYVAAYGADRGYSLGGTGTALSLYSIGSALGAVLIGWFSDRIGSLKTCYGVIGTGMLCVLGFLWGRPFWVYALSAFVYGVMNVGATVLMPSLTLRFFGQQDYEKIYAKVSMGAPLAAILLMPAYGFLYDATGSYGMVLSALFGLLALAAVCIGAGWRRRCTLEGCPVWRPRARRPKGMGPS